jgi:hypothetical protein
VGLLKPLIVAGTHVLLWCQMYLQNIWGFCNMCFSFMYNLYAYVLNYLDLLKQLIAGIDMELCSMYFLIVGVSNPINTYS